MSEKRCERCGADLPVDGGPCPGCGDPAAESKAEVEPRSKSGVMVKVAAVLGGVSAKLRAMPPATVKALRAASGGLARGVKATPSIMLRATKAMPGLTLRVGRGFKAAPGLALGTARNLISGLRTMAVKVWGAMTSLAARVKATGKKAWGACTSWWNDRSRRARLGLVIGGASAVVAIGVAVFLYLFLRPVFVVAVETDNAVVSGDDVVLSIDVSNQGRTTGDCELRVSVDGEEVETELVTLDGGAREQVSISLNGLEAGHYDVDLAGWPELAQNVWVMTPPEFEITAIRVQPNPVDINTTDEVEVLVGLANVGEAPGSHELQVALDGDAVESREVEVEGETHVNESFTVRVTEPGSCEVMVDGESLDVEVYQLERPKNGEELARNARGTYSRVKIKNNDDMDCVVVLRQKEAKEGKDPRLLAVYVRAQSECTVGKIANGTYECYYSFGEDFCTYRNEFTRNQRYGAFDETMTFGESYWGHTPFGYNVTYTVYTLEIGGTSDERSPELDVSPSEFPII